MYIKCKTDRGRIRETNQDYVLTFKGSKYTLLIVADGMGGHNAGETASRMAATTLREFIIENINSYHEKDELIRDGILEANRKVFEESLKDEKYKGMGTTVTCCLILQNKLYLGHVGDSRAYIINVREIRKISEDHSYVQELINKGSITEAEAQMHPQRNLITRAIGIDKYVVVDTKIENLEDKDCVLLCSDGLTSYVSSEEMWKMILDKREDAVDDLINLANERGGSDNISIIIARKGDEDE